MSARKQNTKDPNMDSKEFYGPILAASGAYKFFVGGQWRESLSEKVVSISNPTTLKTAFTVQGMSGRTSKVVAIPGQCLHPRLEKLSMQASDCSAHQADKHFQAMCSALSVIYLDASMSL